VRSGVYQQSIFVKCLWSINTKLIDPQVCGTQNVEIFRFFDWNRNECRIKSLHAIFPLKMIWKSCYSETRKKLVSSPCNKKSHFCSSWSVCRPSYLSNYFFHCRRIHYSVWSYVQVSSGGVWYSQVVKYCESYCEIPLRIKIVLDFEVDINCFENVEKKILSSESKGWVQG